MTAWEKFNSGNGTVSNTELVEMMEDLRCFYQTSQKIYGNNPILAGSAILIWQALSGMARAREIDAIYIW